MYAIFSPFAFKKMCEEFAFVPTASVPVFPTPVKSFCLQYSCSIGYSRILCDWKTRACVMSLTWWAPFKRTTWSMYLFYISFNTPTTHRLPFYFTSMDIYTSRLQWQHQRRQDHLQSPYVDPVVPTHTAHPLPRFPFWYSWHRPSCPDFPKTTVAHRPICTWM